MTVKLTAKQAAALYSAAHEAGSKAAAECVPVPMVVGSPSTPFGNDVDMSKPTYYVADGVCGFAWVSIKPARGSFVTYCKKNNIGRKDSYYGGWTIGPKGEAAYTQSMARKEAYCYAFAKVLSDAGINCYVRSRMD